MLTLFSRGSFINQENTEEKHENILYGIYVYWKREVANNVIRKTYDREARRVHYRTSEKSTSQEDDMSVFKYETIFEIRITYRFQRKGKTNWFLSNLAFSHRFFMVHTSSYFQTKKIIFLGGKSLRLPEGNPHNINLRMELWRGQIIPMISTSNEKKPFN